jgi:hypothetical protein
MPLDIYFLSNITSCLSNLASLLVGCLYCYRAGAPGYLRIFPLYLLVSIAVEFFANKYFRILLPFHLDDVKLVVRQVSYNFFTVFETVVFIYFLYQIIRSTQIKRLAIGLFILFLIYFITSTVVGGLYQFNDMAVFFESVIIVFLCLIFFRELFTRPEPVDLLREPSFWLVTGIFFYLATIFPLFLAGSYLRSHGLGKITYTLYSINNFAISITYLIFIKGYTCRTKRL